MGQIVFQATLGGQVAVAGPNTASSFTLTLPAATDTLVGKATTDTLTNKTLTSPTITGATLTTSAFNGTVGATTPSTGAFTTLSTSSTTTLSGLTASTALALDASKNVVSVTNTGTGNNVLSASPTLTGTIAGASLSLSSLTSGRVTYATTSGLLTDSATLTYNGTTLTATTGANFCTTSGSVGIGNSSPSYKLDIAATTTPTMRLYETTNGTDVRVVSGASDGQIGTYGGSPFSFYTNNIERMRITSGGLVSITGAGTEVLALNKLGGPNAYLQPVSSTNAGLQVKDSGGAVTLTVGTSGTTLALQGGTVSSGTGITFPATQSASSDANTLDDYEEGTWTPVLTGFTIIGATTVSGQYTKIGGIVFLRCSISAATSIASVGATSVISGLPFSSNVQQNVPLPIADSSLGSVTYATGICRTDGKFYTPTWSATGQTISMSTIFNF